MSDTPDTDVYWDQVCDTAARWDVNEGHTKLLQYASRLERERDAERALADRLAEALKFIEDECDWQAGGDHWLGSFGDNRIGPTCDAALAAWKEARND